MSKKTEIRYVWWYGIKPFYLFHFNTYKQKYTDCYEIDYVLLIGWLEIRLSKIAYYKDKAPDLQRGQ